MGVGICTRPYLRNSFMYLDDWHIYRIFKTNKINGRLTNPHHLRYYPIRMIKTLMSCNTVTRYAALCTVLPLTEMIQKIKNDSELLQGFYGFWDWRVGLFFCCSLAAVHDSPVRKRLNQNQKFPGGNIFHLKRTWKRNWGCKTASEQTDKSKLWKKQQMHDWRPDWQKPALLWSPCVIPALSSIWFSFLPHWGIFVTTPMRKTKAAGLNEVSAAPISDINEQK